MIFKGETVNRKREVQFDLQDGANAPILGFNWLAAAAGALRIRVPGGALANADLTRVVEIGGGTYAYQLNDAAVSLAGDGVIQIDPVITGAQGLHYPFTVVDPADFGTSSGGGGGGTALPVGPVKLSDLIDIVRLRGGYQSSLTMKDTYITHEIQAAWGELYEIVANTHEGYWDKYSIVQTMPAQEYIGLPSDCWRVQGVDVDLGDGQWHALRQVGIKDRNRFAAQMGRPSGFRLSVRGLELQPPPDLDYAMRVLYTPIVTTLDNTGIQLFGWEEYIITGALLRLAQREERPTGEYQQELERCKQRVISAATERKSSEPEYLPMFGGGGYDDEDYL